MNMYKLIVKIVTVIAVNIIAWYFFFNLLITLTGLFIDSRWLLYFEVMTTVATLLAWLWLHYTPAKRQREAEKYKL